MQDESNQVEEGGAALPRGRDSVIQSLKEMPIFDPTADKTEEQPVLKDQKFSASWQEYLESLPWTGRFSLLSY